MQPTIPPKLAEYIYRLRGVYGRSGIRLSAPEVQDGKLRLTIEQGPEEPARLKSAMQLEQSLRAAIDTRDDYLESGLELEVRAVPADRWSVYADGQSIRVCRLIPPYQTGRVLFGPGKFGFELTQGSFHLVTDDPLDDKRIRNMVRVAKSRIINQKLFDALPRTPLTK